MGYIRVCAGPFVAGTKMASKMPQARSLLCSPLRAVFGRTLNEACGLAVRPRLRLDMPKLLSIVPAQHRRHHLNPAEAHGALAGERSKPVRLAVRDHHRRSLGGKSPAQIEQWCCSNGRRRIISGSAENRGNSCHLTRKHACERSLGPSCVSPRSQLKRE